MNRTLGYTLLLVCIVEAVALAWIWPRAKRIHYSAPFGERTATIQVGKGERFVVTSQLPGFNVVVWEDREGLPHAAANMQWKPHQEDAVYCWPDIKAFRLQGGHMRFRDSKTVVSMRNWDDDGIPLLKASELHVGRGLEFHYYARSALDWTETAKKK